MTFSSRKFFYSLVCLGFMFFVDDCKANLINGTTFRSTLQHIADKAGFKKLQDIYANQQFEKTQLNGPALVKEISGSVSGKFNDPILAATKIKQVVEDEEARFTPNPIMTECCRAVNLGYDSRFRTQVDVDRTCLMISSKVSSKANYPTLKVEQQMIDNARINPSLKWQYFASEDGYYLSYPSLRASNCGNYDPRYRSPAGSSFFTECVATDDINNRGFTGKVLDKPGILPFYVEAATRVQKDVVVVIDSSGSMTSLHSGKSLLQIAKEAAISVLETLNPNDRVTVVSFDSDAEVIGARSRSCLSDDLAMGTPMNQKYLKDQINIIRAGGATDYEAALNVAFNVFDKSRKLNNESKREKVILFLTDGEQTEGSDPIQLIANRNKNLNNSVIIFTYALGRSFGDGAIKKLQDMANQVNTDSQYGEVKKGEYRHIEDPSKLRTAMASYYSKFSSTESTAAFSVPFQDLFGIGLITAICFPVFKSSGSLMGVACSDVTMSDLLSALTYFQQGEQSYAFIIDNSGRTLMHPLLPQPSSITDVPLFVQIKHLERQSGTDEVIRGMIMGTSGNKTLNSLRTFPRGNVLYEGIQTTYVMSDYYWIPVDNTNLSVALVIGKGDEQSRLPLGKSNTDVHYHRLDLGGPRPACKHFNRYATNDFSVVMLTPGAFLDPYNYLDTTETLSKVQEYEAYLKGSTSTNPGLQPSIKDSVDVTHQEESHWKSNTDTGKLVVWRYLGTTDGVMRVYPGAVLPKNYDHKRRPWYSKAVALKGKYVVSAPYKDLWGSGYLVTMSKTVMQKDDPATPTVAVIGTDFRLTYFYQLLLNAYPKCKEDNHRCFLLDSSGYIVIHEQFVRGTSTSQQIENVHIVIQEPAIAEDLLKQGHMSKTSCMDLENIKEQYSYRVSALVSGNSGLQNSYEIHPITDSNLFVILKKGHPSTSTACCSTYNVSPDKKICTSSQCDCVCYKAMDQYNYCQDDYLNLGDSAKTCSPQPPPLLTLAIDDAERSKDLAMCYNSKCSEKSSLEVCNAVSSCDWCYRKTSGEVLSKQYCGTVYQCTLGIVDCTDGKCDETKDEEDSSGSNIAAIVVPIVVVVVVIVVVVAVVIKRRRTHSCKESDSSSPQQTHRTSTTPQPAAGFTDNYGASSSSIGMVSYDNRGFSNVSSSGQPMSTSSSGITDNRPYTNVTAPQHGFVDNSYSASSPPVPPSAPPPVVNPPPYSEKPPIY